MRQRVADPTLSGPIVITQGCTKEMVRIAISAAAYAAIRAARRSLP
jgi:hypothetical protein